MNAAIRRLLTCLATALVLAACGEGGDQALRADGNAVATPSSQPTDSASLASRPSGPARLLFAGSTGVWLVNLDGTGLRRLHRRGVEEPVAVSADGRRIAFVVGLAGGLWIADVDAGEPKRIYESDLTGPSFTPDGRSLVVTRATGHGLYPYAIGVDGSGLRKLADVEASQVLIRPPGREIAVVRAGTVHTLPLTGGLPTRRLAAPGSFYGLAFSPNGDRIAFAYEDSAGEVARTDLYVSDVDGKDRLRLTQTGDARSPAWSPNGDRILFHRLLDGSVPYEAWVVDTDGTDLRKLIPTAALAPQLSPDGKHLVYVDAAFGLNVARANGSKPETLFKRGQVLSFAFVAAAI